MSERFFSVDALKAIAIFGVVYIHSATIFGCFSLFSEIVSEAFRFAVPTFVIAWSFFVEKALIVKSKSEQFLYLRARFFHLFTVFFLWSLLYFGFYVDFKFQNLDLIDVIKNNFLGNGWPGQYFFIILFQLIVFFPIIRNLYMKRQCRFIIYLLSLLIYVLFTYCPMPNFINEWGYRPFVFWIPYTFIGIAFVHGTRLKLSAWWLCSVLLIPLECYFRDSMTDFSRFHNYVMPSVLFSSIVVWIVFFNSNFLTYNSLVSYLGKNTLIVFVANPFVIKVIQNMHFVKITECGIIGIITVPFLAALIVLSSSLIIGRLLTIAKLKNILY